MLYPMAGLVFVFFWLGQELAARRRLGWGPASWGELYRFGQKKLTPDTRYSALLFACGIVFAFGLWESVLRFLIHRENSLWFFVPGLALSGVTLALRRRNLALSERARLNLEDLAFLMLSWTLLMGAGGTLLLVPWALWRARFLPRKPGALRSVVE